LWARLGLRSDVLRGQQTSLAKLPRFGDNAETAAPHFRRPRRELTPVHSRPPTRSYLTWGVDSSRWKGFRPRPDDIVIVTYPKCGTTWMQRIVGLLVFQDPRPIEILEVSPWIDCRFVEPAEAMLTRVEGQRHRRFLKSHLPADGLPLFDGTRYIHVARDGRDACLSYHNHVSSYTPWMLSRLDAAGAEDGSGPYPRVLPDPGDFFRRWLTRGVPPDCDGLPLMSYFHFERSWWRERDRSNVLMAHYADLLADLPGQMREVADFLGIAVPAALWPKLEQAAGFDAMRAIGDTLLGRTGAAFTGGGRTFFNRGRNDRWRGVLPPADLALYEAKLAELPAALARWLERGGAVVAAEPLSG
jgi:aryl sulfotransferase